MKFTKSYAQFIEVIEALIKRGYISDEDQSVLTERERQNLGAAKQLMKARYQAKPARESFKQELLEKIMKQEQTTEEVEVVAGSRVADFFKHKLFLGFVAAGAVAALTLAIFAAKPELGNIFTPGSLQGIVIPAALAQDNFALDAEKTDARGIIGINSSFILTSKAEISKADVESYLQLGDGRTFTVTEMEAGHKFLVDPTDDFGTGEIIQVRVATLIPIKEGENTYKTYEYQWVFEVADHFKVSSTVPAHRTQQVPTNTPVKFIVSHAGTVDASNFVSVVPSHPVRIETGYKSINVIPTKPWATDTVYTITLKKGFGVPTALIPQGDATDKWQLADDHAVSFVTNQSYQGATASLYMYEDFYHSAPGQSIDIEGRYYEMVQPKNAVMQLYRLDDNKAAEVAEGIQVDSWIPHNFRTKLQQAYVETLRLPAPDHRLEVAVSGRSNQFTFRLPTLQQSGTYLAKMETDGVTAFFLWGISDIGVYVGSTANNGVIWAVDLASNQALADADVFVRGQRLGKTSAQGTLELTQAVIATLQESNVVEIVKNNRRVLLPIKIWSAPVQPVHNYDSFFHLDQNLVHPDDTVRFWGGLIGTEVPAEVEMSITHWDSVSFSQVLIDHQIIPIRDGFYSGQSELQSLKDGYYALEIKVNGQSLRTASFQVAKFTTPEMEVTVTPKFLRVEAGESNIITITTTYFDGAPAANVKLRLEESVVKDIQTDENGQYVLTIPSQAESCESGWGRYGCQNQSKYLRVTAIGAYETEITGTTSWFVTQNYLDMTASLEQETEAELRVGGVVENLTYTRKDLPYLSATDIIKTPAAGAEVTVEVFELGVVQSELKQDYAPYTNELRYYYQYTPTSILVSEQVLLTDDQGRYRLSFAKNPEKNYRVVLKSTDKLGRFDYHEQTFFLYQMPYRKYVTDEEEDVAISRSWGEGARYMMLKTESKKYLVGETAEVRATFNDDTSLDNALLLFMVTNAGMKEYRVQDSPVFNLKMGLEHLPLARVQAVVVKDRQFYLGYYGTALALDSAPYELDVEVKPAKTAFDVRDRVEADVLVTDAQNRPVEAMVNVRVLDKAYLALDNEALTQNPISQYWEYSWLQDSNLIINEASHRGAIEGDGMGGGGGDGRSIFKEIAHYEILRTDKNGRAHISFDLPDNLTTWSILTTAATDKWQGGRGVADITVTQNLRVQTIQNDTYLNDDEIVISAQAASQKYKATDKVELAFYGPLPASQVKSNNIKEFGAAVKTETVALQGRSAYSIGKLSIGDYVIAVRAKIGNEEDILIKPVRVISGRSTKRVVQTFDASAGWSGADIELSGRANVFLGSPRMAQAYRALTGTCLCSVNRRLDHLVAIQRAAELLRERFGQDIEVPVQGIAYEYKVPTGGFALYPLGGSDLKTTSLVMSVLTDAAEVAPDAAVYFGAFLGRDATPEELALALRGLGALKASGLAELQTFAKRDDLAIGAKLIVIDALLEYGDKGTARQLWAGVEDRIEREGGQDSQGGQAWISGDKASEEQIQEWTEYALVIAAKLDDDTHEDFYRYLHRETPLAVNPIQEVRYWEQLLSQQQPQELRALVRVGDKQEFISMPSHTVRALSLTAEQIKSLRLEQVQGPLTVVLMHEQLSREEERSPIVSLSRKYLQDGKTVTTINPELPVMVELSVTLKDKKYKGRYTIDDVLPSGLKARVRGVGWSYNFDRCTYRPYTASEQTVSSVIWLDGNRCATITILYEARAVADGGSYLAEPSVINGVEFPAVRVTTPVGAITIKK